MGTQYNNLRIYEMGKVLSDKHRNAMAREHG